VSLRNGAGPVSVATEIEAQSLGTGQRREPLSRHCSICKIIRADLIGSDICTALGLTARNHSRVLALCRALVEFGHDPNIPLEAYRGDVLCLRIRSIDEGVALEVNGHGTGFRHIHEGGRASPMRQNDGGA
jgi:hypothetical protein